MQAARFMLKGRVQGVFFRASAQKEAVKLGLTGYAKNLPDGGVEVVAYGDAGAIEQLEAWLRHGPPGARVEEFYREPLGAHEAPPDFDIR
ncbi:acylphosphatase [Luteibacter sp. UNCMF331Sha3.1]|uniref:acylphosphatase n=1 Tax=Luteibacter sp. UNCMF331Sha3.1 TaxID=1502760 RepID=UPI0008D01B8B|nr:acylphosphatase [Luteibacter sp. UNCMF331Sha3.1]SEM91274.1 acylphosphatase [Luteibacter sp. UNCMF331Sha3.1]